MPANRQNLTPLAYFGALLGGAFLGGIALALLNRKTINELRERLEHAEDYPRDEIY